RAVVGNRARDPRDDAGLVDAGHDTFEDTARGLVGAGGVVLERPEEHGEPLLPLESLASGREPPRRLGTLPRQEEQHGELGAEDRHARILEVAVALVEELGQVGDDAGPIAADGGEREELLHVVVLSASGTADTTSRKMRCQLRTAPRLFK